MNYNDPELVDRLAAEYVVGTMRGAARRRFENVLAGHFELRRAVRRWEEQLFWLSMRLPPVQPPAAVWQEIARRISHQNVSPPIAGAAPVRLWQTLAASIGAIAVVLGVLLATREPEVRVQVETQIQPVEAAHTAILADDTAPIWLVNVFPQRSELRVQALRSVPLAANQAFELWMLPTSGAAPVSLGLLPVAGQAVLPISAAQLQTIAESSTLAVSIEPGGGSPTGAPTGQIPYTAPLVHTDTA